MTYDVLGIGNALMDILIQVDDSKVTELGIQKGIFNLVDEETSEKIYGQLPESELKEVPGGCVANTIVGVAQLGGASSYYGRVGEDSHGNAFDSQMKSSGIASNIVLGSGKTGTAITFITPDTQRTFAVNLGCAPTLEVETINEEEIKKAKVLHIAGYGLEPPGIRASILRAMEIAQAHDVLISLDIADPFLVQRANADIREIITNYVNIVFANETEAENLLGVDPRKALEELSQMADIAVVKLGEGGSLVKKGDEVHEIPIYKVDAVDTTGAGDMYAAGFLFGFTRNLSLDKCGHIGSFAASQVIEVIGAKVKDADSLRSEVEKRFLNQ